MQVKQYNLQIGGVETKLVSSDNNYILKSVITS